MRHSAGTHRTSSLSSNSDRQMVHFSVLSSKSSVLLFTCDTQQQWTSCWLHISNNTCQCACCTFQFDTHFGLWSYSHTIDRTELTMICGTAEELGKLLVQICRNQSQPVHKVALKGAAIRSGNHEHQDYRASVRMNSDSPSSLWSWQAETMHFRTSVQLNTNSLHNCTTISSVILEEAQRTHDYCMYPSMRWDFFFTIHHLKQRGRGANNRTSNTKVNCIQHRHCLQTEDCEGGSSYM